LKDKQGGITMNEKECLEAIKKGIESIKNSPRPSFEEMQRNIELCKKPIDLDFSKIKIRCNK
jgi:hypothetical protein